jgi:hypothetical protein
MSIHIRERITRKLDTLPDERLYQVLDYVEFLESKYAARQNPAPNALQKFAEGVEDKLRAGRVSATTISETMGLLNRAVGVLNGVAAAGKSVATDLATAAQRAGTALTDAASAATTPPPATGAPATPSTPSHFAPPLTPPAAPPASGAPPADGKGPSASGEPTA